MNLKCQLYNFYMGFMVKPCYYLLFYAYIPQCSELANNFPSQPT